jgi:hypothetical protein
MDMISSEDVIRRIELYFTGGKVKYLSPSQRFKANRGVLASSNNRFDDLPLNIHNAGMRCDRFIETIPLYEETYDGRGIVICAGGLKYFSNAWVCINMLRQLGCTLPIQLWHLGSGEMTLHMKSLVRPLNVECMDALELQKTFPVRRLGGWEVKPYAIIHSPFREVLLLDADNVPVANPEYLFQTPEFQETGAIFWPDYDHQSDKTAAIWKSVGVSKPKEPEFESGQILVDKKRCWDALQLSLWFNANSDFYYQYIHGDKETFHLAFRKVKKRYSLIKKPIHTLSGTMCQHDFNGARIFQHRNLLKWTLEAENRRVNGFWFEEECLKYLAALKASGFPRSTGKVEAPTYKRPRGFQQFCGKPAPPALVNHAP